MVKYPPDKAKKIVNGELERIVEMSVTIGLIPKPTEKDKEEIIEGMYAILKDYTSLNCDAHLEVGEDTYKEGC